MTEWLSAGHRGHNPVGVVEGVVREPRVELRASAQPWALRHNLVEVVGFYPNGISAQSPGLFRASRATLGIDPKNTSYPNGVASGRRVGAVARVDDGMVDCWLATTDTTQFCRCPSVGGVSS
mgnify:CR=1 FL=1